MKTILDHDGWVEIPAGEFLTGLGQEQRDFIVERLLDLAGLTERSKSEFSLLQTAAAKLRQASPQRLSREEAAAFGFSKDQPGWMLTIEEGLSGVPPSEEVRLGKFYIARYPITENQYDLFERGTQARDLPGTLEEPEIGGIGEAPGPDQISGRWVAAVRRDTAMRLCLDLGARLPTDLEWEKAARGTDGRLYPWDNRWNPEAGFFYYGQSYDTLDADPGRSVTGFSQGVSPYGVWSIAGGLPELVEVSAPRPVMTTQMNWHGKSLLVDIKGCHAKESSKQFAWFDHILALQGRGHWVSLRPVLDEWPQQSWSGHRVEARSTAESP